MRWRRSAYSRCVTTAPKSAIVVGAGIIGQASAFALARHGVSVTIFDPTPGGGATHAAAGMIAPSAEVAPGEEDNYALQLRALPAWRKLSNELIAVTGERVDIFDTGTLIVGWDASDRRLVSQYVHVAREFGVPVEPVDRASHPDVFEGISGRINEGFRIGGDAWLDPDQAMRILRTGNEASGVTYQSETVTSVRTGPDFVEALVDDAVHRADVGLLSTGVASLPSGSQTSAGNTVRPVRGMTVRIAGFDRSDQPTVRAFVHGHMFYMVSRPGGYCILGATSEERSQQLIEVGETQRLLRDALDIVPAIETANILETRVGLRPASADLRPFFEVLEGGRWAWSSGHYRHGVTLAALAAVDAVDFVEATS